MEDSEIVRLFTERNESALSRVSEKYGVYCASIARNILKNREEAEECVNDAYLKAWNSIPPNAPNSLGAYIDLAGFFGDRPLYDKPGASKIIDVENTDAVETAQNPDTDQPRTMIFPIEGGLISDLPESSGGYYGHKGVDITAPEGTPILAAESGTVVSAEYGFNSGRGNYVEVKGDSGLTTIYEHCRELFVNEGEKVNAGDIVGYVGSTGYASGNHLHFEVRKDEEILNPMDFLPELNPSDFQQSDNLD